MKKPRALTAEEIRHWRESNRHTEKSPEAVDLDIDEDMVAEVEPVAAKPVARAVKAPVPSKKNLSPLKQLSIREAARSFKPYGPIEAALDLHGLTKLDAYERVQHFIIAAKRQGKRHVIIITGKGRGGEVGVLRANLPHWLNEPALRPLISAVAEARQEKGGAGVMHVLVKHHER
jgi:DNA-nicking Smr family endonuclease